MKRSLIDWNRFEEIKSNSLSKSVKELVEAEDYIAQLLGVDGVALSSYDNGECLFEVADGTFFKANFAVDHDQIVLENCEQLVIDESAEQENVKSVISEMLEAVFDDKEADAQLLMDRFMEMDIIRRRRNNNLQTESVLQESAGNRVRLYGTRGKGNRPKLFVRKGTKDPKKSRAAKLGHALHASSYQRGVSKRKRNLSKERTRRKIYKSGYHSVLRAKSGGTQYTGTRDRKKMNECLELANNVFSYINLRDNGHVFAESVVNHEDGSTTIALPTSHRRNEGKVLMMQFDVLKTDVKILRENARKLTRDGKFCQLVAEARKANAVSDDELLEKNLGAIVKDFPSVLYLTHTELSKTVAEALNNVSMRSYGDEDCKFIAEGILRNAHSVYTERVNRLMRLAQEKDSQGNDEFEKFQNATGKLFATLDESVHLEFKMFEDLYNATAEIRKLALESQNDVVRADASNFLSDLEEVLSGRQPVNLDLAVEVADWLETIAESNIEGESWTVDKTPFITTNGDNPQMGKNAKKGYTPSQDFSGDWGDPAPVSDGKSYKNGLADEMRGRSWGNIANKDTYPDLKNPYSPDPSEFTMPHDKGVDKDHDDFGTWGDSDTWPTLSNPYVPKAMIPKQKVDPSNPVD